MMMSFVSLGVVGLAWALLGYSLAFTTGNAWLGDLSNAMLKGVGLEAKGTIPHALFMAFQGTFAIITAALISGAIIERMRFSAYVAFITIWAVAVYAPIAHWVWGGGWLAQWGALDFAGGTVVHINAAVAALVAALVVGKRSDTARRRFCRTTCHSSCSAPGCCGSVGLVSMPAARSRPARKRASPS
jgi:Amt family ammonium transporter